jgi:PPK2 family polyphosphate:nucleotide phosphotransferase
MVMKIDPKITGKFKSKEEGLAALAPLNQKLYDLLYLMFAEGKHSLLVILHGIDTSGKDGVVRHLFSAANPQGLKVFSFKKPSEEELRHDFLWRCHRVMPEAGYAAIFNRSYYEEVTTVQVHPEMLKLQRIPDKVAKDPDLFKKRYEQINAFERILAQNGTIILKFLLHISKAEQKQRLEERLEDHTKNWKFSPQDIEERKLWNPYMDVFGKMIKNTNTEHAPWHAIPSDKKWYRNYLVTKTLVDRLSDLKMKFPKAP